VRSSVEPTIVEAKTRGSARETPVTTPSASGASRRRSAGGDGMRLEPAFTAAPDALVLPPKALPPGLPPGFPQLDLVRKWTGPGGSRPSSAAAAQAPPAKVPPEAFEASLKASFEASLKAGLDATLKKAAAEATAQAGLGDPGLAKAFDANATANFGADAAESSVPSDGVPGVLPEPMPAPDPAQAAYVQQYQQAYERYYQEWQEQYELWYRAQWQQWQQEPEEEEPWVPEPQPAPTPTPSSPTYPEPAPATPRMPEPRDVNMNAWSSAAQTIQQEVLQEMQTMFAMGAPLDDRKSKFKRLMLQYHPDKADKAALDGDVAKAVFQFISAQKAWFLLDPEAATGPD